MSTVKYQISRRSSQTQTVCPAKVKLQTFKILCRAGPSHKLVNRKMDQNNQFGKEGKKQTKQNRIPKKKNENKQQTTKKTVSLYPQTIIANYIPYIPSSTANW